MAKQNLKLQYGLMTDEPDTIVLQFTGTGIDPDNPEHKAAIEQALPMIATALYAVAHGIDPESITLTEKRKNKK